MAENNPLRGFIIYKPEGMKMPYFNVRKSSHENLELFIDVVGNGTHLRFNLGDVHKNVDAFLSLDDIFRGKL